MSVMVVVQGNPDPTKAETLQRYQQAARTVIAKHGGEVLARGGGLGKLHGSREYQVGIVVRFPDKAAAEAWYSDPDYQAVLPCAMRPMRTWTLRCTRNERQGGKR